MGGLGRMGVVFDEAVVRGVEVAERCRTLEGAPVGDLRVRDRQGARLLQQVTREVEARVLEQPCPVVLADELTA